MPIYSYACTQCGARCEQIISYAQRDNPPDPRHNQYVHAAAGILIHCDGRWVRDGVEAFALGKPAYQMKAVLANGDHIKGHFGKSAKLKHKKRGAS